MLHIKLKGITKCSNTAANILPADPLHPPTLGMGSIGQNLTFLVNSHVAYRIKWDHIKEQHDSKCFAHRPLPFTLGGQNTTFSEQCHVAYQVQVSHECSNMVANILHADRLLP